MHRDGWRGLQGAVDDQHGAPGRPIRPDAGDAVILDFAGNDVGLDRIERMLRHDRYTLLSGRACSVSMIWMLRIVLPSSIVMKSPWTAAVARRVVSVSGEKPIGNHLYW